MKFAPEYPEYPTKDEQKLFDDFWQGLGSAIEERQEQSRAQRVWEGMVMAANGLCEWLREKGNGQAAGN